MGLNALANEVSVPPRRIMGLDKAALEHKLNDWGNWLEERLDYEGYPQSDAVAAALDGAGGGTPGHRILCLVMPHRLWSIHQRILRLPEHEHAAVIVWYIPSMRIDRPREYVLYDQTGNLLPRRYICREGSKYMLHEVEASPDPRPHATKRFVIQERGGSIVASYDLPAEAANALKALGRAELLNFGRPWSTLEKAERLGIREDALYQRLHRARQRLLGVLPLFVGIDCQSEVK